MGKLGTTNYLRGQFKRRNYWKLEEGESIYRIIPPYGSLAESGRWSYFWRIHFGFCGTDGKMKPVACIQNKDRNGLVSTVCPICEFRTQLEIKERELRERGESDLTLKPLRERIRAIDPDAKHFINVMSLDGQLGCLKIPTRSMKALQGRIDMLRAEGVDPINPEGGVFFVFRRKGIGLDTQHEVDVYTESVTVNGERLHRTKQAPLTEAVVNRIESDPSEIFDLPNMYKRLTEEELAMLVYGDAKVVDRLFARPERNGETGPAAQAPAPAPAPRPPVTQATASSPLPAPTPAYGVPAGVVSSIAQTGVPLASSTAPVAGLAQAQAPAVEAPAPVPPPVKAAPRPTDVASMSDEEFESLFQTSISTKGTK